MPDAQALATMMYRRHFAKRKAHALALLTRILLARGSLQPSDFTFVKRVTGPNGMHPFAEKEMSRDTPDHILERGERTSDPAWSALARSVPYYHAEAFGKLSLFFLSFSQRSCCNNSRACLYCKISEIMHHACTRYCTCTCTDLCCRR